MLAVVVLGPAYAQPALYVEGANPFDLDTLLAGTVAEKVIAIKNTGSDLLIIEKVEPSCGCTGSMMNSSEIKPGDSEDLQITFNSKNFAGKVHKSVTITSNDPAKPKSRIDFTAFVIQEIKVSDPRVVFKDAVVGMRRTATLTLTNNSKENLLLTGYESTLEGLELKYPEVVEKGATVELEVDFTPKEVQRVLNSDLTLRTNNSHKPEIQFKVFGNVKEWKFE